ncbi:MAG: CDP-alcohol phosphatidyltransferase family protein [Promethearchaeota archaeon]
MALTAELIDSWIAVSVEQYQKTTKKVSEVLNTVLYRPLAFPFVLLGKKLKLTPNFFTTLSIITMLISAFFYSQSLLILPAILLFIKQILDCVDGSLARLTNQFSKFGEIYDFVGDIVGFIAVTLCMAYSISDLKNDSIYYLYYILMAISVAIGTLMYNTAKSQYSKSLSGKKDIIKKNPIKSTSKLKFILKRILNSPVDLFHYLTKFPDITSPMYSSIDGHYLSKTEKKNEFKRYFEPLIKLWSFIAGAASITIVVILTLVDAVELIYIVLPVWILGSIIILSYIQRLVTDKFKWNFQT